MSLVHHYISSFLNTEITSLPSVLNKYAGNYYNNAIGNGVTWLFVIWTTVHFLFDESLDAILKRMRYKRHVRNRMKSCLWYLGFYGVAFVYCSSSLFKHLDLGNKFELDLKYFTKANGLVGFLLLCVFHAHMLVWEALNDGSKFVILHTLFLTLCLISTYFLRSIELTFVLITLIGITNVVLEITRCLSLILTSNYFVNRFIRGFMFVVSVILFVVNYMIVIPLTFIVPTGLKVLWSTMSPSVFFFNVSLMAWFIFAVINSVLFRMCKHWLYHSEQTVGLESCPGDLIECSLFELRDDEAYKIKIIRREIKERQAKLIALRKPKNRNMLIQTLKCMVAIKRKLNEKRAAESSDSEESEKSESEEKESQEKIGDAKSEDETSEMEDESNAANSSEEVVTTEVEGDHSRNVSETDDSTGTVYKDVIDSD